MKSKFISFMLAIFSVFTILGHKVSADTISIVSDTAYAPFEFKDTDQEYKGIDVDIIAKVAEISKWDYKMDFPGFDAAVNSVQAGQADAIMAGMSVTEARKKVFTFSDPYYDTKIVIVTRKSDKITAYDELKGKVVGVKNGTAAQTFLVENQDKYGYTLKVFDTNDLMYNSLGTGALDAVMDDKPVVQYAISQGQDLRIEMEGENVGSFAFAVKKGSKYEYLIDDFNKALAQMKADGSYQAIIDKWTADAEPAQATPVKDTYTIVSDSSFAPFEYQNEAGDYVGIDMDLIQAIADQQGFNIKISNPGFDAALNSVQAGQADAVIAGMSITDARKEIFDFSESYYTSNILLAVKAGSGITSYADLNGKVVGAKTGTASYNFFEENQDKYGYTIKTFDEATGMYDSLNTGAIDALMDDEAILLYAIQQGRDFETPVLGEPSGDYGFAVKKGNNPELIEMFNNGLAALKTDGTYDEIVAKYLGETIANAKATPVKDSYTIVSDSAFAPFEYQDDAGNYVGIDMELIQAIADEQGFNITISNPGFDAALNSVQAGQADAVIAGMSITDARKEIFDFSTSYYTSNILLAVKSGSDISSYEDLKGKTVGAKTGTASYNFFEENQDKYGYTIKTFDEATGMYDSLNSGAIDALMDDEAILRYAIQQGRNFDTPIAGEPSGDYGFAVKKGSNPELIEMFNYGLAALKADGTYDAILAKYLGETENETTTGTKTVDETTIAGLISNNYKQLLAGLGRTLSLAIISFALATVVGIIFGLMAVSPVKALRVISSIFVDVVRGIPLMIVAAFIFWGVPNFIESITGQQSPINDFVAGVIALTLNGGAYIAEIVRGGIQAVPVGQMEASRTLGVPYNKTMSKIILPQAFKLMLPSFINQFVISLKDTTIISAIGLVELFQTGKIIIARNYQSFRMYAILAVMYLVIITLLTRLAKRLEKRS